MPTRDRWRGFTLPELLSTLGIVGVSLSLVAPGLNTAVESSQRAQAVNGLVAALHTSHSAAITRNRQVTLCPSPDGRQCQGEAWEAGWIQFVDGNRDGQADPGEELLGAGAVAGPYQVHSPEFTRYLAFLPSGRVVADGAGHGGAFHFCHASDPAQGRILQVTAAGRPELAADSGDASIPDCREPG